MKNTQKGFTLIELLVVIAIIGILATIVLTSLSSARGKAQDAKVQAQLSSMRAQAELYYNDNGSYGASASTGNDCSQDLFASGGTDNLSNLITAIDPGSYTVSCYTGPGTGNANAWAVTATNGVGGTPTIGWCVDSNGDSKVYPNSTGGTLPITIATGPVCP